MATKAQLAAAGVGRSVVRANVAADRWQLYGTHVVVMQSGELSPAPQEVWAAVLEGGPACALDGLSPLHEQGLQGFPVDRLQLVLPASGTGGRTDRYVRRRCRDLASSDIHPVRRPRQLTTSAALVHALRHIENTRRGCALMAAVVQQRLIRTNDLRPIIAAAHNVPHQRSYLLVAGDIEGGSQSLLEIDFSRLARRARLPAPGRQAIRCDSYGRRRYLDADFGCFAVEVDGAVHLRPAQWWDDMWRQNDIVISGKPIIRFASVGIRFDEGRVIQQLQRAHHRFQPR